MNNTPTKQEGKSMSKYEVKVKVEFTDHVPVEAENTTEAMKKAIDAIKKQYGLVGDEITVEEIQEDFI